jgi:hypothetical protein
MLNKILYFGAGTYLEPIVHFSETQEFILGDSLPRNAHGFDYYSRLHYGKYFMLQLEDKIKRMDLTIVNKRTLTNNFDEISVQNLESQCMFLTSKNKNKNKNIKYYTSTSLPFDLFDNKELQSDIETCDTLLICGYSPDRKILKYIQKPFNLIGYSSTYFPSNIDELNDDDNKDDIIYWIMDNPHSIKSYTVVDRETGEKYHYSNYWDFYVKLQFIKNSKILQ